MILATSAYENVKWKNVAKKKKDISCYVSQEALPQGSLFLKEALWDVCCLLKAAHWPIYLMETSKGVPDNMFYFSSVVITIKVSPLQSFTVVFY